MNIDMTDTTVIVTGASQGLGETIAIEFAKSGADVAIIFRSQKEKAKEIAEKIRDLGRKALPLACNVADSTAVTSMIETVNKWAGKIDVLVNNAAINPKRPEGKTPIYQIEDSEWDTVMSINLAGAFYCTREAMKIMTEQGFGSIVNISSLSGQLGNGAPVGSPYCISKAGMICMSKCAALDGARYGIRVNTIAPGPISGPTNLRNTPEVNKAMAEKIPLKRIADPEEIAWAVIFLASDFSGDTTGQTLNINGGWYMP